MPGCAADARDPIADLPVLDVRPKPRHVVMMSPAYLTGARPPLAGGHPGEDLALDAEEAATFVVAKAEAPPLAETLPRSIRTESTELQQILARRARAPRTGTVWRLEGEAALLGRTGLATLDGRVFPPALYESSIPAQTEADRARYRARRREAAYRVQTALSLHYPYSEVYFHAVNDIACRLAWLNALGLARDAALVAPLKLVESSFFGALFGDGLLQGRRVLVQDDGWDLACERLYVVRPLPFHRPSLDAVAGTVRRRRPEEPFDRRLVLVRGQGTTTARSCGGFDRLEAALNRLGFASFDPAAHPLAVQKWAFSRASHVVSLNGSGLANMIFSQRRGCRFDVLMPEHWVTPTFGALALALERSCTIHLLASERRGRAVSARLDRHTAERVLDSAARAQG